MILSKIYTRTGDDGTTSLIGGTKIEKNSIQIEAYGTVDELSSHIGLLCSFIKKETPYKESKSLHDYNDFLTHIQNTLFQLSIILASDNSKVPDNNTTKEYHINNETTILEHSIDKINESLPQLNSFILSGGSISAAECHVCRTVCRRAERRIIAYLKEIDSSSIYYIVGNNLVKYINRLSDFFFVMARKLNYICNEQEKIWQNTCK